MVGVVRGGTGTAAAIPGVAVAGKTGTAELESTVTAGRRPGARAAATPQATTQDTDAWFVGLRPRGRAAAAVAVGVLLVGAGAGGDTAAPAAPHPGLWPPARGVAGRP